MDANPQNSAKRGDEVKEESNMPVNLGLSENKLAFSAGKWSDLTDQSEIASIIHPTIAENINLKERAKKIVELIAENNFEIDQYEKETAEAEELIARLKPFVK